MKHLKSPAARGALALVAGSAALALTACGAGQISQTANQVPVVNGTSGAVGDAEVRDVSLIIQEDSSVALKFNASNKAIKDEPVVLKEVKIDDATLNLSGETTLDARCNLVVDSAQSLKSMQADQNKDSCTQYHASTVTGSDFYPGASRGVTFTFNEGTVKVDAPVTAFYPESGTLNRGADNEADGGQTTGH